MIMLSPQETFSLGSAITLKGLTLLYALKSNKWNAFLNKATIGRKKDRKH